MTSLLREHARHIWQAAVDAVRPEDLVRNAFASANLGLLARASHAPRVIVVGAGKAGGAMSAGLESALTDHLDRVVGVVNVPTECVRPLRAVRLNAARPQGINEPTVEGVAGTREILDLLRQAGPRDVAFCLLSGGGSALMPAPVDGVSLADKQYVTRLLHACGATIQEMNTVRKHLSQCKGGQLARIFKGTALLSLIISDVIGDQLDVIASGPTAVDSTTFSDALAVLRKYRLTPDTSPDSARHAPARVLRYLEQGEAGAAPETLKALPAGVINHVIGNNGMALDAAATKANEFGYRVINLGSYIQGETSTVAAVFAALVRSIRLDNQPCRPPVCLLSGGETTVTLAKEHGLGGRNQEFVLAVALQLGHDGLRDVVILSGGTDGEDGPTDAAGAIAEERTLSEAARQQLSAADYLRRNDSYHFFEATGDLLKTGLTQTNVMDARVILIR